MLSRVKKLFETTDCVNKQMYMGNIGPNFPSVHITGDIHTAIK